MVSAFSLAQAFYSVVIEGVDSKVKAAYTFYGDDFSFEQQPGGLGNGFIAIGFDGVAGVVGEVYFRTAAATGDRLGVKAAVGDVGVLGGALLAHRKRGHCGVRAVVGDGFYNGISRAAVGAVYKGIAVAKVFGGGHFPEAVKAGGDIGGYLGESGAGGITGLDDKFVIVGDKADVARLAGGDFHQRGPLRFRVEAPKKSRDICRRALQLDGYAFGIVINESGELELRSQAVDKRAEAHALDTAGK